MIKYQADKYKCPNCGFTVKVETDFAATLSDAKCPKCSTKVLKTSGGDNE